MSGRPRCLVAAAMILGAAGCGAEPDSISREDFIGAYVGLRLAELRGGGPVISEAARDSVLAAREIGVEDLEGFVEAHGDDPVYMSRVWGEVEDSMETYTTRPDTAR